MLVDAFDKTLRNIWPQIALFVVIMVIVRIISLRNGKKKATFHSEFLSLLFIVYIILLFELLTSTESSSGFNLIPFSEITRYKFGSEYFIYNVIGNILLFIPFGYFVTRETQSKKWYQVFLATLLTSVAVELLQLKIGRTFDIDDIILNVIGGILGYIVFRILDSLRSHLPSFLQKDGFYNFLCVIILGIIVIYLLRLGGVTFGF